MGAEPAARWGGVGGGSCVAGGIGGDGPANKLQWNNSQALKLDDLVEASRGSGRCKLSESRMLEGPRVVVTRSARTCCSVAGGGTCLCVWGVGG